jgi:hypothetical protein
MTHIYIYTNTLHELLDIPESSIAIAQEQKQVCGISCHTMYFINKLKRFLYVQVEKWALIASCSPAYIPPIFQLLPDAL